MLWIDDVYHEDRERMDRWQTDGVEFAALNQPRSRWRKWLDRCRGYAHPVEKELAAFAPNVMVLASGTDKWYASDSWRLKKQFADRCAADHGTLLVMMHQLSEAGAAPGANPEAQGWLAWQKAAPWHQFVSGGTRRETEENFGLRLPGEIVRNNYNVPYDDPPPWPAGGTLRLAFVGRLDIRQKGLDLLLEALADPIWRDLPDWELDIFGTGEAREPLERQIAASGLAAKVRLRGRTDDIRGVWAEHHALVMPSRAEGLSLALCEAMLCDRPAIASAVGGTGELLEDERTGWKVRLEPADLVRGLIRARAAFQEGRLPELGREAGRQARAVFPAQPEERYLDQLEAAVAAHRGAGSRARSSP